MQTYLSLLHDLLTHGRERTDRTGTGTLGLFGAQLRFDLQQGFPLLTTKRIFWRGLVAELLWMLSGDTNAKTLQAQNVHIWDAWATAEQCARFGREEGDLGPIYGWAWRHFGGTYEERKWEAATFPGVANGIDQMAAALHQIRTTPDSRRILVTGWDPREVDRVALPPCHTLFQFYVQDGELSCQLYQRSADAMLGVPFNIASYALLTHLVAHVTGLRVGTFVHTFGDVHLYKNHVAQAREQLTRTPRPLPQLRIARATDDLFSITADDLSIEGYDPHPAIKAEVSV